MLNRPINCEAVVTTGVGPAATSPVQVVEEEMSCLLPREEELLQARQQFDRFLQELPTWIPHPRVREIWLPIEIAKTLLRSDGSVDLSNVGTVICTFCTERDDIDKEIAESVKLLEDPMTREAIQELPEPCPGSFGERMIRAMLRLEKDAPITQYHSRLACLASLLTLICQEDFLPDCCIISLWNQVKRTSPKSLVADFKELITCGGLHRRIYGTEQFFPAQDELIPRLRTVRLSSVHSVTRLIKSLTVASSFLEKKPLRDCVLKIRKERNDVTLEDLIHSSGASGSNRMALLSLEAYTQNVFFQVWNNTVTNLLISKQAPPHAPEDLLSNNWPEYVWLSALYSLVENDTLKKKFYDIVQNKLALSIYTCVRGGGVKTFWAISEKREEGFIPVEEVNVIGKILAETLKEVTGRNAQHEEIARVFTQNLSLLLSQVKASREPLVLQQNPVGWEVIGHSPYALTSRYFSLPAVSGETVSCDPEKVMAFFDRARKTYTTGNWVTMCVAQGGHLFRLFPNDSHASFSFLETKKTTEEFLNRPCANTPQLSMVTDRIEQVIGNRQSEGLLSEEQAQLLLARNKEISCSMLPAKVMIEKVLSTLLPLSETESKKLSGGVLLLLLCSYSWGDISKFEETRSAFVARLNTFFTKLVPRQVIDEIEKKRWRPTMTIASVIGDIVAKLGPYLSPRQQEDAKLFFETEVFSQGELSSSFAKKTLIPFPGDLNYQVFQGRGAERVRSFFWYNPLFCRWELMSYRRMFCTTSVDLTVMQIPSPLIDEIKRRDTIPRVSVI